VRKVRAVISDFDGPINDSFFEGLQRIESIARKNGVAVGKDERRKLVDKWGTYGPVLMQEGFGVSKEMGHALYREWEAYDEQHLISLVQGAREALEFNRSKGIMTTVLTSRNRKNILAVLEGLNIWEFISFVQTPQD